MKPRLRTWIWATVGVTVVCGGPLALLYWFATAWDDIGKPQPADCAAVMTFAHGSLPESAEDARCTEAHFQDTFVTADFRMERAEVESWLSATYPAGEPALTCEQDLCVSVPYDEGVYADVSVTYEDGVTALVRVKAYTT
ncbi:hypothetical protein OG259_22475 [Streptomyces sp. NBC_00250]|uniref:hypothetical protein n=1 Tax=Streptomyces sp. NBC_00250 TaxID=2903641 RepID=UPI002E2BE338|nr:hypothetical protein [Streptomyces sp. NBC_00250]